MTNDNMQTEMDLDSILAAKQQGESKIVDVDEPQIKLVIFQLADSFFALPGHAVREVLGADVRVNFVPGMHVSVEGVINLRGDIESVLSLNPLLQLPLLESAQQANSSILMCRAAGITTGIRIDCLHEVTDVAESLLKTAPESLPEHLQGYVSALLNYNDWTIAVLDLDVLLNAWQEQCGKA